MVAVVLYQPDIAQNMGAVARTCVCLGAPLHLIEPMGFVWNEPKMRRAGMDYLDQLDVVRHKSWEAFLVAKPAGRLVAMTTKGATPMPNHAFLADDLLLFGRESAGLPDSVHDAADARVVIPMQTGARSMNLAQSAAITLYTALAQTGGLAYKG